MNFLEFYNSVLNISITSYEDIPFSVEKHQYAKGETITKYSQIENRIYFIVSGIAEMTIKSYMTEKVIDFFFENELVCGYTSFLNQEPTDIQIKALTNIHVEAIKHEDMLNAYKFSLDANKFGRITTEQGYIRKSNREKNLLTKTAEERYIEMFQLRSQYISQIPVNKIAKYLGIHPESLSRIRKKINS